MLVYINGDVPRSTPSIKSDMRSPIIAGVRVLGSDVMLGQTPKHPFATGTDGVVISIRVPTNSKVPISLSKSMAVSMDRVIDSIVDEHAIIGTII